MAITHNRTAAILVIETITDFQLFRFGDQNAEEFVVDSVLDVHTGARGAILAGVI